MKKISRIATLVLALAMLLSVCIAEDITPPDADTAQTPETTEEVILPEADDNPVLVTINGDPIAKAEVDGTLTDLYNASYIASLNDYQTGIAYIVQNYVIGKKLTELGLDQFSDEEQAAFAADAQKQWDDAVNDYVEYFLSEDTEEARAELAEAANQYYIDQGVSMDMLIENAARIAAYEKMEKYLLEGQAIAVTDEEIDAIFQQEVGYDREKYQGSIANYEYATMMMGGQSWYTPAGYRGVTHILLAVDSALMDDYKAKLAAYEEAMSTPAAEETAAEAPEAEEAKVTLEDVKAAKAAILASVQGTIDEINEKLAAGTAFNDLIAEYGTDPGMDDPATLETGYAVHQESLVYDADFTAAAFSEKMVKPGDVSDPTVSSFGVHIVYYLRDIPEGAIEMTDDIRTLISNYLTDSKTSTIYANAISGWIDEFDIVYNNELIAELTDATPVSE